MVRVIPRKPLKTTRRVRRKTPVVDDIDEAYDLLTSDPEEYVRRIARRDPVVFAESNLRNEKEEPLEYTKDHGFQVDYLRDFADNLMVKKSSQVGITTQSVTKVAFLSSLSEKEDWQRNFGVPHEGGITIIYTFPTDRDVQDFSSARFKPMISSSQHMLDLIGGRRGINFDTVGRKRIGKSTVYFRGTFTERQAISVPADLIVTDELDFSDMTVVSAFNSRLSHSKFKWWWKFSTPTLPNFGIDNEWKISDQREWFVKCIHCGKDQRVLFPDNIMRKRIKGVRYTFWGCRKCGKELDRTVGSWQARHPSREYHGYYIPPMICPWIQPLDLLKQKDNYRQEREFYNYGLGMTYAGGEDVLDRELLLKRVIFGPPYNPTLDKLTFMGVDQGDKLHYEISRKNPYTGKREIIKIGVVDSFDDIGVLMNTFDITHCHMDALPNKKNAESFAKTFSGRVSLVFYKDQDDMVIETPATKTKNAVNVDRTGALDLAAKSWRDGDSVFILDQHGSNKIPAYVDDPSATRGGYVPWVQQMGNMVRAQVENKKTGKNRAVWQKTGADHFRHADGYNWLSFDKYADVGTSELIAIENQLVVAGPGDIMQMELASLGSGVTSGWNSPF